MSTYSNHNAVAVIPAALFAVPTAVRVIDVPATDRGHSTGADMAKSTTGQVFRPREIPL